jgi:signal transduction histidine kinase
MVELTADFNDMTARLAQYDRELSESGAMLAHELRTPLNAAMGRVQGMLDDVFPRDATQLAMVYRQLEQINRLVDDLRLLSLALAGQLRLEHEPFNLADLVRERLSWLDLAMKDAGVRSTAVFEGELTVHGDRDRVGQVVLVLMENVLKHAAAGGVLELRAWAADDSVELEVADRGPGVAEEELPRLLDRFWRADQSRSRDSGGSGLGLAIAEAICKAHGGALSLSHRERGGLRATVSLPSRIDALEPRP